MLAYFRPNCMPNCEPYYCPIFVKHFWGKILKSALCEVETRIPLYQGL